MFAQVKAEQSPSNCYLRANMNYNTWNLELKLPITLATEFPNKYEETRAKEL